MNRFSNTSSWKMAIGVSLLSGLMLAGCSDNDHDTPRSASTVEFDITVTNLTANQPLSPVAVLLHDNSWQAFQTGVAASEAVELLAEGGDNSLLLSSAMSSSNVIDGASGSAAIGPGASETVSVEIPANELGTLSVSLLSMLVNTNDAFAAVNGASIAELGVNEQLELTAISYDSGTEANTETADSIPGPAGTGGLREGFNATRDDVRDAVHVHAGVVTQDTGLSTSALTEAHRWDNSVASIVIERIQ